MTNSVAHSRQQFVVAAFTVLVCLFAAHASATAQGTVRKYKAGDKIDMGRGVTYEIVECRVTPNTREEECDFIAFSEDGSASNINTVPVTRLRRDEQLVKAEKKRQDVINGRNKKGNQPKPQPAEPPQQEEPETEASDEPEITVSASQLYKEYSNNDTAARNKYVGRTVRVTGAIIYNLSETSFSARFSKTYTGSTIQCYLEDIEQAVTLNKGETLTLVGKPLGSLTSTGVIFEPCRIERKTANQTAVKPAAQKMPVKTAPKSTGGAVVGTWYYTAIIGADGTEQKLSNGESYLWLKEDGSYENRFGATGQIGTFAASGNRLTLNRENAGAKSYTMTIAGATMTLKNALGGYKLKRE